MCVCVCVCVLLLDAVGVICSKQHVGRCCCPSCVCEDKSVCVCVCVRESVCVCVRDAL